MEFGYHHVSFADPEGRPTGAGLLERAQFLDEEGFSWLSLMDHLWQIPGNGRREEPFLDCYTGLPAVAAVTESLELSGLVTCVHYRNPAYLARTLASLDAVSDGRAVLGIGAGWYREEYEAYGYDFPDPATRIRQMRDAIELCRALWYEESPVTYEGEYYDADGVVLEPKPDEIPVLVGGGGEQLTLRVAAEYADRWNVPGASPEAYEHKLDVLRDHCADVGRDYDDVEKTVAATVVIRDTTEAAHEAYEDLLARTDAGPAPRDEFRGLVGTPEEVAAGVEAYAALGVDLFAVKAPKNDAETVERFVDEVMPAV